MTTIRKKSLAIFIVAALWLGAATAPPVLATDYYVSSSQGDDDHNDGLTPSTPFATVSKVNALDLSPGDRVLFKCGDTWRGEMLHITQSGTEGNEIFFGSYPETDCPNKPVLSGALPVAGWSLHAGNIYLADLSTGENAGKFPYGINQLFVNGERKATGRWPNINAGNGGYSFVDSQPADDKITDNELPSGDWTGAVVHIMGMRWYILNRIVTATEGNTLVLGESASCWGGCDSDGGWGYFLNNHINTLDMDCEWFFDNATSKVYLFSTSGLPQNVEGSAVLKDDDRNWGGVTFGVDLKEHLSYAILDNFEVKNWFRHGISTPTNYETSELHHVAVRNCAIKDVDEAGLKFAAWVWNAQDGRSNGWRGGYDLTVENNVIDGANHFGIDLYSRESSFTGNTVQNIGLIENVNKSGIGCGYTSGGGSCTESGDGIRVKIGIGADTGNNNLFSENRIVRVGYNGMDIFGYENTLQRNLIEQACATKADCGGVRTFGRDSLEDTNVYDIVLEENIVVDTVGNVDAANDKYNQENFGFGLYIDHYSKNVAARGNSIIRAPSTGILYQDSTGSMENNTVYDCSRDYGRKLVSLTGGPTAIMSFTGNTIYAIGVDAFTLGVGTETTLASSDGNRFYHPFRDTQISADGSKTFEQWQAYSGLDGSSEKNWFSLAPGDSPISQIYYNGTSAPKSFDLGQGRYLDPDRKGFYDTMELGPFESKILVSDDSAGPDLTHCMAIIETLTGLGESQQFLNMETHDLNQNGKFDLEDCAMLLQYVSGNRNAF